MIPAPESHNLTHCSASHNSIEALDASLLKVASFKALDVRHNPLPHTVLPSLLHLSFTIQHDSMND